MGYSQQDAHNLNRSQDMFGSIGMETGQPGQMLTLFPIASASYADDAAEVLSEALMSATRLDQDMNVWIDVRQPHIPEFVGKAIANCSGFGLRLVLTHNSACSHAPGEPLSAALVNAIACASDTAQVWHPLARRMVGSIRHLAGGAA